MELRSRRWHIQVRNLVIQISRCVRDVYYSALSALYGNVTQEIASGVSQGTGCLETDWGAQSCPTGYRYTRRIRCSAWLSHTHLSFVGSDQNHDGERRYICCESGIARGFF